MIKTRNNHYVPRWYQEGFFEPGREAYSYLDLSPPQHMLPDGRVVTERSKFVSPTSRAFVQRDLYSTFFGTSVNDEIERKLFGDIDTRGAHAVRAFISDQASEWHRYFTTFFEYLDVQKTRTPKGLDWLSAQYPYLAQNDLMREMQGIRMMHCTIWTEGVREVVSAQDANVKFIVSDHPVTIYNHAMPPSAIEPSIALKGSQTVFPMNRNFCLILTNLEYAQDHSADPTEKRTFAGHYRNSMVRTDALIRTRNLTNAEVIQVNRVIKAQAKRYIAAGKEEWLYPEASSAERWTDVRHVFLPPAEGLWGFGGEMYARFENGEVRYQDAFGRTEKERDFLKKMPPSQPLQARKLCGCGSGRAFGLCCQSKPIDLRPTWLEYSIRERNVMLATGISKILGITTDCDWSNVRREITDKKIRDVYGLYDALWPRETNLLAMLPKPDGRARAIYTGVLHPSVISKNALGLSLYFEELLIELPFTHPRSVKKDFSPLEHPKKYRQEFLKSVVFFMSVMPLVEKGIVTLFPDPCNFDLHLRDQMLAMAGSRSKKIKADKKEEAEVLELTKEDHKRSMLLQSNEELRRQLLRASPEMDEKAADASLEAFDRLREQDPLAVLQENSLEPGKNGGQLMLFWMAPNFEITMYLAQATGSCIVTDSASRWQEFKAAAKHGRENVLPLAHLRACIEQGEFVVPQDVEEICVFADAGIFDDYSNIMKKSFKYLARLSERCPKRNVEAGLSGEFRRVHALAVPLAKKLGASLANAQISCLWPAGGIQDNTINRLLLMSNSEHHLTSVPMALLIERIGPRKSGAAGGSRSKPR